MRDYLSNIVKLEMDMYKKIISPPDIFIVIFIVIATMNCGFWFWLDAISTGYMTGTVVSLDAETIHRVLGIETPYTPEYTFDANGKIMAETPIYKEPGYVLIKDDEGYYYDTNDNYILGQKVWYKPYKKSNPASMVSATDPLQKLPPFIATIISTRSFLVVVTAGPFMLLTIASAIKTLYEPLFYW